MGRPKGSRNVTVRSNDIILEGSTLKIVIVSPKYGNLNCLIDADDYEKVRGHRWQVIKRGSIFHVQSCRDHTVYLHREILSGNFIVNHIDGDGLNNKKENLRPADKTTNAQNRRITPHRKLPKGVTLSKSSGKYFSRITVNTESLYLGTFKTKTEAAIAYNEAALKYFGEFARLNEIPDINFSVENTEQISTLAQ